jgi:hypothetical protein
VLTDHLRRISDHLPIIRRHFQKGRFLERHPVSEPHERPLVAPWQSSDAGFLYGSHLARPGLKSMGIPHLFGDGPRPCVAGDRRDTRLARRTAPPTVPLTCFNCQRTPPPPARRNGVQEAACPSLRTTPRERLGCPTPFESSPTGFLSARRPFSSSRRPSSVPRRVLKLPARPSFLPGGVFSFPDR